MSLAPVLRQSLKVNLAGWRPGSATRCALALAVMLLGGTLFGHPEWGVAAAIGAFNAGLASLTGVYRTRLRLMLQICLVTFGCALLGGLVGHSLVLAVLVLTLGSLLFSLYGEVVPSASTLTLQATMTLLIISGLQLPPSAVPGTALLVLLGGAAQVLVLGVVWPLDRHQPERRSVSLVFAALADFVQGWDLPPEPGRLFPDDTPFRDALASLGSAQSDDGHPRHTQLRVLLEEAEGLRAALISLGLEPWVRSQDEQVRLFRRVLVRVLTRVRRQVRQGQSSAVSPLVSSGALRALRVAAHRAAPPGELTAADADPASTPLALTLDLLKRVSLPGREPTSGVVPHVPPTSTGRPAAFRDLRPTPGQWKHALRLALAIGLSDLLVRLLAVPHGYWLPLTVGVVLRADYVTTVTRGAARLLGTLAAVLLGLVVGLAHPAAGTVTLLVLAAAWLAYSLLQVGYAPFSAAVSLYVIFSVSASGLSQGAVAEGRLLYTVLGGVVAVVAFLVWPIWQAGTARERLRQVAVRQQEYAAALLRYGEAPSQEAGSPEIEVEVEQARSAARTARVGAEGAVLAAAVEPRWASGAHRERETAQPMMARLSSNAARLLALQLKLGSSDGPPADPATRTALEAARQVARQLEQQLSDTGSRPD